MANTQLLSIIPFASLEKWYVEYYLNSTNVKSYYPIQPLSKLVTPVKRKIKKDKYDGILPVVSKIIFKTGSIVFRAENKTGMDLLHVRKGDLLVSSINFHQGAVAFNNVGDFVCSTHYQTYIPNTKIVIPEYLVLVLRSPKFLAIVSGIKANGIKNESGFDFIGTFGIPVPPISVQRKILDEYHKLIEKVNKQANIVVDLENKINDYITETVGFKSINKSDSSNCLITEYRLSELSRWDIWTDKEKIVSNKYPISHLKDLIIGNPFYGANEKAIKRKGDVRYIRITDINEDGSLGGDFVTVANVDKKYLLSQNDFLIARSGNTVGKTFLYDDTMGEAIFAGYLIKFVLNRNKVMPKYMLYYTKSTAFKKWIASNQRISGQPNINGQEYLAADIILPPVNVQTQIVEKIEKLRKEKIRAEQLRDKYACSAVEYFAKAIFTE